MKLLRLKIIKADTCGGLLDGLDINFRSGIDDPTGLTNSFSPLCLIGPNGTGKSQILQIIAEIFQATFHRFLPEEEQANDTGNIEFEIEYYIPVPDDCPEKVRIFRRKVGSTKASIVIERFSEDGWSLIPDTDLESIKSLLPSKVIGYTSGDNETLSIPFFVSRAGYAKQVTENAIDPKKKSHKIQDTRMLLIDYGTNLEVLISNLLLNPDAVRSSLLEKLNLSSLNSFRCVIQLNHAQAPGKKGVEVTDELQNYIDYLKKCSTTFQVDLAKKIYKFDFFVGSETYKAFNYYWKDGALDLYSCFHKLAMLNDLIIPKAARTAFNRGIVSRKFSTRLPEPFDDHKVFRFERVEFISKKSKKNIDYVSLSDGEHQLAQLLGTVCMASFPNVLFLLDEPESHFNPRWRVEFLSNLLNLPTATGKRIENSKPAQQDCLITTHAPFVPSDMKSENVLIFNKDSDNLAVRLPNIETYGSTFDTILEECFKISPPMSDLPKVEIEHLLQSDSIDEIKQAMSGLGDSVERMYLADRIRMLKTRK
ncbi:MAG: restriction system-associated AAA family ATPase [Endozoicomonas sp.]|uniref:restriction system-associated AAA family ATPase n=1 Tax=Endozoicomonas sp. TaxID=1892382 RepID=UPI003D9B4360